MTPNTGGNMKLYRNTGTYASPTWVLVSEIGDVTLSDLTRNLAALKRRAKIMVKSLAALIAEMALEFRLIHGLDATTFTLLITDFFAGTVKEWAIMDGLIATPTSQGLRCPFLIESLPWDQPLEDVSGHDVKLSSGYLVESTVEIDAVWYTVPTP